jgi:thiamine biosynthesis protein ThiS
MSATPDAFTVVINGDPRTFDPPPANVAELVATLALGDVRIAVELNRRIVRRAVWGETPIAAGDTLEIVHFVGGGA